MKPSRPLRDVVLIVLAASTAALACYLYALRPTDELLLHEWQRELSQLPDNEVEPRLAQIAAASQQGLPLLVACLHNSRSAIAEAATRQLDRRLDEWQQLSASEHSAALAKLAAALARRSSTMGPHSRLPSMRLVQRILVQTIDREAIDGSQLAIDCETVLRVTRVASSDGPLQISSADETERLVPTLATNSLMSPQGNDILGEDGLASSSIDSVPSTAVIATPSEASSEITTERSGMTSSAAPSGLSPGEPSELLLQPPLRRPTQSARLNASSAPPLVSAAKDPEELESLPDLEVMRRLVAPDVEVVSAAVRELTRRGFQPLHLNLAERLVTPDAQTRLELVSQLPLLAGIDARPWLLLLSRDPDAAVRAATVRLLATSNDPTLRAEIERLAREETDDGVLRVVRQVRNASRVR